LALKKSSIQSSQTRVFNEFIEAQKVFEDSSQSEELRLSALEYIINHKEIYYVLRILSKLFKDNRVEDHIYIDYAFANFEKKPRREADFEAMFNMLKSENAYLRNAAIKFLQTYGVEAKPFIEKLINSEDRDIRIFAINILGDVRYEDSIDMLRYFILKEKDVNALMTAVDYLGEIGCEEDIALLEALKTEHKDEPYVTFGIDMAIERIRG
jgi:HEAT repeat protein